MRRNLQRSRRIRFEPDPIINGVVEALFASEVPLGCLHRDMSQEELYLLQLTACLMTETGTGPTVMPHAALCRRYAEFRIMPNL